MGLEDDTIDPELAEENAYLGRLGSFIEAFGDVRNDDADLPEVGRQG